MLSDQHAGGVGLRVARADCDRGAHVVGDLRLECASGPPAKRGSIACHQSGPRNLLHVRGEHCGEDLRRADDADQATGLVNDRERAPLLVDAAGGLAQRPIGTHGLDRLDEGLERGRLVIRWARRGGRFRRGDTACRSRDQDVAGRVARQVRSEAAEEQSGQGAPVRRCDEDVDALLRGPGACRRGRVAVVRDEDRLQRGSLRRAMRHQSRDVDDKGILGGMDRLESPAGDPREPRASASALLAATSSSRQHAILCCPLIARRPVAASGDAGRFDCVLPRLSRPILPPACRESVP